MKKPIEPSQPKGAGADDEPRASEKLQSATSSNISSIGSTPQAKDSKARAKHVLRPFDNIGSFQILKHLGEGGMADVYVARALLGEGVDKLVALKTVLPEFGPDTRWGAMFLREARVCATLRHANLVQIFAFGEAAGRAYLSMEYIHGRDLSAVIKAMKARKQLLGPDFAVAVAIELCKALEYVHTRRDLDGRPLNLVHRDVSPGNVILSENAEVKLMDFGVAAVDGSDAAPGLTVGKVPYMSMDQARGGAPKPQWDLFAVGVMLFEMLTLRRPYKNVAIQQIAASREVQLPKPSELNPNVPPELDELVLRAVKEKTAFTSAAELRVKLEKLQAQVGMCDLSRWVRALFAEQLQIEQAELEALTSDARKRSGFKDPGASNAVSRRFHTMRRRVAATRTWMALSQRPWLLRSLVAATVLVVAGGGAFGGYSAYVERQLQEHLDKADAQAAAGRLVGATGSEMLGELLVAAKLKPADPRVQKRLRMLGERLQQLGDSALARQNREEAAAHFEAALKADPHRAGLRDRLEKIQEEILRQSRGRIVQQQ